MLCLRRRFILILFLILLFTVACSFQNRRPKQHKRLRSQPIEFVLNDGNNIASSSWYEQRRRQRLTLLVLWSSPSSSDKTTITTTQGNKKRVLKTTTGAAAAAAAAAENSNKTQKNNWDHRIAQLRAFKAKYGHCLVAAQHEAKFPGLYQWTRSTRRYRHAVAHRNNDDDADDDANSESSSTNSHQKPCRGCLPRHKLQQLLDLEFCWDVQSATWDLRLAQLRQFQAVNKHCRVPNNSLAYPGLGVWVRNQRREHRKSLLGWTNSSSSSSPQQHASRSSTLTPERLEALEELNFEWYKSHAVAWQNSYEQLRAFYEQYGHSNIPQPQHGRSSPPIATTENGTPGLPVTLGHWCMNQRTEYKKLGQGVPTALTADRIKLLEQLNFQWNVKEDRWQCMLDRLKDYHRLQGHVHIAVADTANKDLRLWLIWQRYEYHRRHSKKGSRSFSLLTAKRVAAVEAAIPGFCWKARNGSGPSSEDWAKLFDAMRDKGLAPGVRPKQHWFEGTNPFSVQIKDTWTEQDLLELWNQETDEEDNDAASDAWYN
jgi:hypothetical protein